MGTAGWGRIIFISSESATNVPVEIILKEAYRRFCVILWVNPVAILRDKSIGCRAPPEVL